jgi:hypothetical protein
MISLKFKVILDSVLETDTLTNMVCCEVSKEKMVLNILLDELKLHYMNLHITKRVWENKIK